MTTLDVLKKYEIKYSHALDFAVEITSKCKEGTDITPEMVATALKQRIDSLLKSGGLIDAIDIFDTHVQEGKI